MLSCVEMGIRFLHLLTLYNAATIDAPQISLTHFSTHTFVVFVFSVHSGEFPNRFAPHLVPCLHCETLIICYSA